MTRPRPLTVLQMEILEFERHDWPQPRYPGDRSRSGVKESAIFHRFAHSATRYYQLLNQILDTPAAEAYDPMLVRRLRRLREQRQALRGARRTGFEVAR